MKTTNLTCVECPMGCDITVTVDNGVVVSVEGNTCKRGKLYAENEVVCPKRVLTTTVKSHSGKMVPVKTDKPVEKAKTLEYMKESAKIVVDLPIKIGDVVKENFVEGVNLIATDNI